MDTEVTRILSDLIQVAEQDLSDSREALMKSYLNINSYGIPYLKNSMILSELKIMQSGLQTKTPETTAGYLKTFLAGSQRRAPVFQAGVFTEAISLSYQEATARISLIIEEFNRMMR